VTDKQKAAEAARERLRAVGLRPTRQRLALAELLFAGTHRHVSAEQLHSEALRKKVRVSLATVYNTLHQFTEAGILRELVIDSGRSYFDTNVTHHHHFFFEGSTRLQDIPGEGVNVKRLPAAPEGTEVARVDVIIRLKDSPKRRKRAS
jgi:Fur family iron response transcriptional regulator